ncbi:helix-turn-helix domain-containing protein, partial [Agrobacterium sp.]
RRFAEGMTKSAIARELNVSRMTIYRAINSRKTP